MQIEDVTLAEWEELLPETGVEVFHTPPFLSALASAADGRLRLLAGFKGDQPVGLLPVFERSALVGRAVVSPPPMLGVPRLGPVVMSPSPKPHKRERLTRRFVDAVLGAVGAEKPLTVVRMRCPLSFADPRPFEWRGFRVEPAFTYVLNLEASDLEAVMADFSSGLRSEFRYAGDSEVVVAREGLAGAERIVDQLAARYETQDGIRTPSWTLVRTIIESVGDGVRVYVARDPADRYLGGIVALVSPDAVYFWQGGVGASYDQALDDGSTRSISVNAAIHRTIIEDILTDPALESVGAYDLVGANTPRLCEYKSTFGGRLVPYYIVESTGVPTAIARRGLGLLDR